MPAAQGQVGEQLNGDGASPLPGYRQGRQGDIIVSELHGRFYEQNFRKRMYSAGLPLTAITNATFTVATLGAACTPILGLYNPTTSGVNVIIAQAVLSAIITALQATGAAPYLWAVSAGNNAINVGAAPVNRATLLSVGAMAKNVSGLALTGLTNNLVVLGASALGGGPEYNAALLGTATGFMTPHAATCENLDGSFIVPPGGVLALLAAQTPVAVSAAGMLVFEEVPV